MAGLSDRPLREPLDPILQAVVADDDEPKFRVLSDCHVLRTFDAPVSNSHAFPKLGV